METLSNTRMENLTKQKALAFFFGFSSTLKYLLEKQQSLSHKKMGYDSHIPIHQLHT